LREARDVLQSHLERLPVADRQAKPPTRKGEPLRG
jgi:hypothetical protein